MANILYSYALDAKGKRRGIREQESPRPFSCGDCDNEMIAKRGRVRRWHYAHKANVECVPKPDPDNALHRYAQDIIVEGFNERLRNGEPYDVVYDCKGHRDYFFDPEVPFSESEQCKNTFRENIALPGAVIYKEKSVIPNTRSDVVVELPGQNPFLIEVVNTHDLEEETRRRYEESDCRVVVRKVTWENLEELAGECTADDTVNVAEWKCDDCTEKDQARRKWEAEERAREKQRRDTLKRRMKVVDAALAKLVRGRSPKPRFKPWYEVHKPSWGLMSEPVKMFPRVQRTVFANATILTELGFEQHNRSKPYLFRYRIRNSPRVFIYADLGGSDVVRIYEDTAAMLYAPDLEDEELEQYAISAFGRKLEEAGVSVRVGFESSVMFEHRNVDPTRYVNSRMLNSLVSNEPLRQMDAQRKERERQRHDEEKKRGEESELREQRARELREMQKIGSDQEQARWTELQRRFDENKERGYRYVKSEDELLWLRDEDDDGE